MKKGIMRMLEALSPAKSGGADESSAASAAGEPSPAERLGEAMLERLGIDPAEDAELVNALIEEWGRLPRSEEAPKEPEEPDEDEEEPDEEEGSDEEGEEGDEPAPREMTEEIDPEELEELFSRGRRPVPMRTGSAASRRVDYSDMSAKQFAELKKLIRRADADGKRIKL